MEAGTNTMIEMYTDAAVKKLATKAVREVNSLVLQMAQAFFWRMLRSLGGLFTVSALDLYAAVGSGRSGSGGCDARGTTEF